MGEWLSPGSWFSYGWSYHPLSGLWGGRGPQTDEEASGDGSTSDPTNDSNEQMGIFPREAKANVLYGTFGLVVVGIIIFVWKLL